MVYLEGMTTNCGNFLILCITQTCSKYKTSSIGMPNLKEIKALFLCALKLFRIRRRRRRKRRRNTYLPTFNLFLTMSVTLHKFCFLSCLGVTGQSFSTSQMPSLRRRKSGSYYGLFISALYLSKYP